MKLHNVANIFIVLVLILVNVSVATAQNTKTTLPLVGNIVPTLIDNPPYLARASNIVEKALEEHPLTITATTQAWSGSGLRNGSFVGFIDHYSLNIERAGYLYSEPYMVLPLHIASRLAKATDANRLDKIYRSTVGIENRFANTDALRSERSVRWARTPDFLANIQQLAGRRVDYIIADKFMLTAFNKLLKETKDTELYLSTSAIYKVSLRLAIKEGTANAQAIIDDFNNAIKELTASGELENVANQLDDSTVVLDEALYEKIVRRW
jgi:polar amino acid transport system substrate-binding protein